MIILYFVCSLLNILNIFIIYKLKHPYSEYVKLKQNEQALEIQKVELLLAEFKHRILKRPTDSPKTFYYD